MAGIREIKRHIKSVQSTGQMVKAMKMVSVSKLRRTQNVLTTLQPYVSKCQDVLGALLGLDGGLTNPYISGHEKKSGKVCYVFIAGNRGLCGMYNNEVARFAREQLRAETRPYNIVLCGRWAKDYFVRQQIPITHIFDGIDDFPTADQCREVSTCLLDMYNSGEVDEIYLIYQQFINVVSQKPVCKQFLPVHIEASEDTEALADCIFEPSKADVLDKLLNVYLHSNIQVTIISAKVGEHSARMTAMSSASDNTEQMINDLKLNLNRARQSAVTTELIEIVSGAAAI